MKIWMMGLLIGIFSLSVTAATQEENNQLFEKIFADWTTGFNQKNLTMSCGLFSKEVIANYRGIPTKNYADICNGFKTIFNDQQAHYYYRFKIRQVYRQESLAAVRITWFLTIKHEQKTNEIQDEGLDILQKNANHQWQIINYLGYPVTG